MKDENCTSNVIVVTVNAHQQVLDKAERLRELEHTVLSALLRLKELVGVHVC